jgi:hypothetical protein
MNLEVGDIVILKKDVLRNQAGTKGVVFHTYPDFDDPLEKQGAQIIFKNGEYDGFSAEEQDLFLSKEQNLSVSSFIANYKFDNVMKVSYDFEKGFWNEIFNKK